MSYKRLKKNRIVPDILGFLIGYKQEEITLYDSICNIFFFVYALCAAVYLILDTAEMGIAKTLFSYLVSAAGFLLTLSIISGVYHNYIKRTKNGC